MAPKWYFGRYKTYKKGTAKLVHWLAKTGSLCCDLKTIVKYLGCGLKIKHKKHKNGVEEVEIQTKELLKLAEVISKADPSLPIPDSIIQTAREVIKGREQCAGWYAAQALSGDSQLQKENESHRYFTEVLVQVLKLLVEAREKQGSQPSEEDQPARFAGFKRSKKKVKIAMPKLSPYQPSDDGLSNLFMLLNVEEPSIAPLGTDDPPPAYSENATFDKTEYKLEKEEDPAFATWCFLQDLHDVRTFVNETWTKYIAGELSFLAASSITDVAFGLLRYFGICWFTRDRALWLSPGPEHAGTEPATINHDVNIVELLCPIAILCIYSCTKDMSVCCAAHKEGKPFPTKRMGNHQYHKFCCVLFDMSPELHAIAHSRQCGHLVVDEFVQALAETHRQGKMNMWMVVTCQIYLDIYDMLGSHVDHGVDALQRAFRNSKEIASLVNDYTSETNDDLSDVSEGLNKLKWVANASSRYDGAVLLPGKLVHEHAPTKEHKKIKDDLGCSASKMKRQLPAHAGALLADLKFGLYDAGCQIANHDLVVLSAAHLYKALRAMGILKTDWQDMDFVLSSAKEVLVTKLRSPYDGEATARQYLAAMGLTTNDLAKDGGLRPGAKPKGARTVAIASPLLQKLSGRQASWQQHGIGYTKSKTVEVVLQALARSESNVTDRDNFTPVQLLSVYKATILKDEPNLNFDYVGFTLTCARLLHSISNEVGPILGVKPTTTSKHIPTIVRILRSPITSPAITETTLLLQDHLATTPTNLYLKAAHSQSSGRIPKHLRPYICDHLGDLREDRRDMRTVYETVNCKFMFSGRAMSAYHAKIKPELCTHECPGNPPAGGETEPTRHSHDGYENVVAYGSAIPRVIVEEAEANARKDPKAFRRARRALKREFGVEERTEAFKEEFYALLRKFGVPEGRLREVYCGTTWDFNRELNAAIDWAIANDDAICKRMNLKEMRAALRMIG